MFRRIAAVAAAAVLTATALLAPAASAQPADPNYVWRTDLMSKALAGKLNADRVLHLSLIHI